MALSLTLSNNVVHLMSMLVSNGYEAYLVGGGVRDLLLHELDETITPPIDFDITTNAKPNQIKIVFKKYKMIYVGERHGTIAVRYKGQNFDITTYRIDGEYVDGRRPKEVKFVDELVEDLARRDLTINAIAVDINGKVIDPFSGQQDLINGIIRTVGNPEDRFEEDSLRLLRAVRFAARFNFKIEAETFRVMQEKSVNIMTRGVSPERIFIELKKTFDANVQLGVQLLYRSGLFREIFGEATKAFESKYDNDGAFDYLTHLFDHAIDPQLTWVLVHSIIPISANISPKKLTKIFDRFKGMKKSNKKHYVNLLSHLYHGIQLLSNEVSIGEIRRFVLASRKIYSHVHTDFWAKTPLDLLAVSRAVYNSQNHVSDSPYYLYVKKEIHHFIDMYDRRPKLVSGDDAKSQGARGRIINALLNFWDSVYYRSDTCTKDDLLKLGMFLKEKHTVNFQEYLQSFSISGFRRSKFSVSALKREIRIISDLLNYFGGLWVIKSEEQQELYDLIGIQEFSGQEKGIYWGNISLPQIDFPS